MGKYVLLRVITLIKEAPLSDCVFRASSKRCAKLTIYGYASTIDVVRDLTQHLSWGRPRFERVPLILLGNNLEKRTSINLSISVLR